VDQAISEINEVSSMLATPDRFPTSGRPFGQLQQELNTAAAILHDASTDVAQSTHSATLLATTSRSYSSAYNDLVNIGMEIAGQTKVRLWLPRR